MSWLRELIWGRVGFDAAPAQSLAMGKPQFPHLSRRHEGTKSQKIQQKPLGKPGPPPGSSEKLKPTAGRRLSFCRSSRVNPRSGWVGESPRWYALQPRFGHR